MNLLLNNPIANFFDKVGQHLLLLWNSLGYAHVIFTQPPRVIEQCYIMGYRSLPIISILSFFIGAVLALQAGFVLSQLSVLEYIGSFVGLSSARELAPVMVAFLLAGRVGSAITAELASMKVYSEIDALHIMNVSPEKILVMPRLWAAIVLMPFLSIIAILVCWLGGAIIAEFIGFIQLSPQIYWRNLQDFIVWKDVADGMVKAWVFGFAVVLIACNQGLTTTGGPREIGNSVTKSVVNSMIFILFTNFFITRAQM